MADWTERPWVWRCTECKALLKAKRTRRQGGPCTVVHYPKQRFGSSHCTGRLQHAAYVQDEPVKINTVWQLYWRQYSPIAYPGAVDAFRAEVLKYEPYPPAKVRVNARGAVR